MVVSWNDTTLGNKPGNPNEAIKRLVAVFQSPGEGFHTGFHATVARGTRID
jgi:hypothetical protein